MFCLFCPFLPFIHYKVNNIEFLGKIDLLTPQKLNLFCFIPQDNPLRLVRD
jgi:hypothetical protein